jgi:hypothetical protein
MQLELQIFSDAAFFAEFFLRQFCDAHTCDRGTKPFPKGGRVSKFLHRSCVPYALMLMLFQVITFCIN